jgi:hypothetical protein
VARHIFQAFPVWIYITQSIKNFSYCFNKYSLYNYSAIIHRLSKITCGRSPPTLPTPLVPQLAVHSCLLADRTFQNLKLLANLTIFSFNFASCFKILKANEFDNKFCTNKFCTFDNEFDNKLIA